MSYVYIKSKGLKNYQNTLKFVMMHTLPRKISSWFILGLTFKTTVNLSSIIIFANHIPGKVPYINLHHFLPTLPQVQADS